MIKLFISRFVYLREESEKGPAEPVSGKKPEVEVKDENTVPSTIGKIQSVGEVPEADVPSLGEKKSLSLLDGSIRVTKNGVTIDLADFKTVGDLEGASAEEREMYFEWNRHDPRLVADLVEKQAKEAITSRRRKFHDANLTDMVDGGSSEKVSKGRLWQKRFMESKPIDNADLRGYYGSNWTGNSVNKWFARKTTAFFSDSGKSLGFAKPQDRIMVLSPGTRTVDSVEYVFVELVRGDSDAKMGYVRLSDIVRFSDSAPMIDPSREWCVKRNTNILSAAGKVKGVVFPEEPVTVINGRYTMIEGKKYVQVTVIHGPKNKKITGYIRVRNLASPHHEKSDVILESGAIDNAPGEKPEVLFQPATPASTDKMPDVLRRSKFNEAETTKGENLNTRFPWRATKRTTVYSRDGDIVGSVKPTDTVRIVLREAIVVDYVKYASVVVFNAKGERSGFGFVKLDDISRWPEAKTTEGENLYVYGFSWKAKQPTRMFSKVGKYLFLVGPTDQIKIVRPEAKIIDGIKYAYVNILNAKGENIFDANGKKAGHGYVKLDDIERK